MRFEPGGVSSVIQNSERSWIGKNELPTRPVAGIASAPNSATRASTTVMRRWRKAQPQTRRYQRVSAANARSKNRRRRVSHECWPMASGSAHTADSIGSSENDTNKDTITEAAMVSANGANHCSAMPPMKAMGTNTTTIEKVVAATARPISAVPSRAAWMWSLPISMCRTMFSRTTMASSMRMPIASDRPRSDIVLRVKPKAATARNDAMTDTGRARPVMTVERHDLRNRNTTRIVSSAPSSSEVWTSATDSRTRTPESFTVSSLVPGGRVSRILASLARTASLTSVVE